MSEELKPISVVAGTFAPATTAIDNLVEAVNALSQVEITPEVLEDPAFAQVLAVYNKIKDLKNDDFESNIKAALAENYLLTGEANIVAGDIKITYVPGGTSTGFNKKGLQKDYPDIYANYVTVSAKSDSIRFYEVNNSKDGK